VMIVCAPWPVVSVPVDVDTTTAAIEIGASAAEGTPAGAAVATIRTRSPAINLVPGIIAGITPTPTSE